MPEQYQLNVTMLHFSIQYFNTNDESWKKLTIKLQIHCNL